MSDRKLLETILQEIRLVKDDVSTLKGDVSTLKDDVSTLKEDVSALKVDVRLIKRQQEEDPYDRQAVERNFYCLL